MSKVKNYKHPVATCPQCYAQRCRRGHGATCSAVVALATQVESLAELGHLCGTPPKQSLWLRRRIVFVGVGSSVFA